MVAKNLWRTLLALALGYFLAILPMYSDWLFSFLDEFMIGNSYHESREVTWFVYFAFVAVMTSVSVVVIILPLFLASSHHKEIATCLAILSVGYAFFTATFHKGLMSSVVIVFVLLVVFSEYFAVPLLQVFKRRMKGLAKTVDTLNENQSYES